MAAPFTLEQFTGVNNQLSPEDMGKADLAACTNFDVNDSGSLVGRPGLERVWTGDAHSLAGALGMLFFRSQDKLLRLDGSVATEVDAGLAGPTCYIEAAHRLYYSDGARCRVLADGQTKPWGMPPPVIDIGGAAPGNCLVTATYLRGHNEFGAATPASVGESVTVSVPDHPDATHKAIYLSHPGGSVLYRAAVVPASSGPITVNASMATGPELETLHKTPPPGHAVSAAWNGRLLVGVGPFLLFSAPFRFELFDPLRQSIPFSHEVTMLASVSPDSLIVGTTHAIYRLSGADIAGAAPLQIAEFGAVRGAHALVDASLVLEGGQGVGVVFATAGGFCFAGADGSVANLSGSRFRPGAYSSGSACFSRRPGNHSVTFTLRK